MPLNLQNCPNQTMFALSFRNARISSYHFMRFLRLLVSTCHTRKICVRRTPATQERQSRHLPKQQPVCFAKILMRQVWRFCLLRRPGSNSVAQWLLSVCLQYCLNLKLYWLTNDRHWQPFCWIGIWNALTITVIRTTTRRRFSCTIGIFLWQPND